MTPHPLAVRLVEHLRERPSARVLELASGRGRNTDALRKAGLTVVTVDDRTAASATPLQDVAGPFDAVLSTHGLLHGTTSKIGTVVSQIAGFLSSGAPLYATFGSVRDARFGSGERLEEFVYAPETGDERGIAHAYFDRARLGAMLAEHFRILSLEEHVVDEITGRWAHSRHPLSGAVHWFAIARAK